MLSKLERGAAFGTTEIAALARALNVCVQWLESGAGPMEPLALESISPEERKLLDAFRAMDAEGKDAYLAMGEALQRRKERIIVIQQPQPPALPYADRTPYEWS